MQMLRTTKRKNLESYLYTYKYIDLYTVIYALCIGVNRTFQETFMHNKQDKQTNE